MNNRYNLVILLNLCYYFYGDINVFKTKKQKNPIEIKTTLKEKIISFRFKLTDIDYGLCFPKKRRINTYFYCQKVDIVMTDKDNNIVKIFLNEASEKRFKGPKKTYFTYVFKGNTLNDYKVLDHLNIISTKKEKEVLF